MTSTKNFEEIYGEALLTRKGIKKIIRLGQDTWALIGQSENPNKYGYAVFIKKSRKYGYVKAYHDVSLWHKPSKKELLGLYTESKKDSWKEFNLYYF